MTNVSAILSFGMIPLWLLVVPAVVSDVEIIVPFKDIAIGVAQASGFSNLNCQLYRLELFPFGSYQLVESNKACRPIFNCNYYQLFLPQEVCYCCQIYCCRCYFDYFDCSHPLMPSLCSNSNYHTSPTWFSCTDAADRVYFRFV